jgi:hypothetical protein
LSSQSLALKHARSSPSEIRRSRSRRGALMAEIYDRAVEHQWSVVKVSLLPKIANALAS